MGLISRWTKNPFSRKQLSASQLADHIHQLTDWILASTGTVALTGAGISTRSGIPDFRSPQAGLWLQTDPMQVASIWGFRQDPTAFYEWIRPLAQKMRSARPNSAHMALAQLESHKLLRTIITQNIDDLHQRAGSEKVLHVHGLANRALCLGCGEMWAEADFWQSFLGSPADQLPTCKTCSEVMKPDVVLFGEDLPHETLQSAQQAALDCDLMIVVGSSLEVMPAADLPLLARRRGAKLVIINLGNTQADHQADLVIRADVTQALPLLAKTALARQSAA